MKSYFWNKNSKKVFMFCRIFYLWPVFRYYSFLTGKGQWKGNPV